jgi:DNA-binding transcriptional ArsR family regulator
MLASPDLAAVAALLGDPTRARMLGLLMDGQAQTATELALEGGVAPSTASSHLARLTGAGLLEIVRQGRHRYFRIAGPEVAGAIEALMGIAPRRAETASRSRAEGDALRHARVCYDHLAGAVAVRLLAALRHERLLAGGDRGMDLTPAGEAWCADLGLDVGALRGMRRPLCRPCLDWSERRTHLAGALGAALLGRLVALRLVRRRAGSRAVDLSPHGEAFLDDPVRGPRSLLGAPPRAAAGGRGR